MDVYQNLAAELNIDSLAAEKIISACSFGAGLIHVPKEVDIYPVYRFFCELINDGLLPIRKVISVQIELPSEFKWSSPALSRQTGVRENTLTIIQNLSKIIFPTKAFCTIMVANNVLGDVRSTNAPFQSQSKSIKALNDVHILYTDNPLNIILQTYPSTGKRSIKENFGIMLEENATPILSSHTIWDNVRLLSFDPVNNIIFYKLTDLSDETFRTLLHDFIRSPEELKTPEESLEEKNYISPGYWAEWIMNMQTELAFKASDKRGWSAISRALSPVRCLKDFEDKVYRPTKREAALSLANIKMVSEDLAFSIIRYAEPTFKRRME